MSDTLRKNCAVLPVGFDYAGELIDALRASGDRILVWGERWVDSKEMVAGWDEPFKRSTRVHWTGPQLADYFEYLLREDEGND